MAADGEPQLVRGRQRGTLASTGARMRTQWHARCRGIRVSICAGMVVEERTRDGRSCDAASGADGKAHEIEGFGSQILHRPDDGLDGESWRFNGLAARVCKTCTRPFAFSFAFVPVRGPRLHLTEHDQTRYVCRLTCCNKRGRPEISSVSPHPTHRPLQANRLRIWGSGIRIYSGAPSNSRDNFIFCVARKSAQTKRRV
jgi:hypothetical protein